MKQLFEGEDYRFHIAGSALNCETRVTIKKPFHWDIIFNIATSVWGLTRSNKLFGNFFIIIFLFGIWPRRRKDIRRNADRIEVFDLCNDCFVPHNDVKHKSATQRRCMKY